MLEKLKKMLASMEKRQAELKKKVDASTDAAEVRSLTTEARALDDEIAECRGAIAELEAANAAAVAGQATDPEGRSAATAQQPEGRGATTVPSGPLNVLATYGAQQRAAAPITGVGAEQRTNGKYDTMEYRMAFMDFVLTGKVSEALGVRADATAKTTDIGAIIPTTIINKAIEKMTDYGQIYARINKTNFKGGVKIPINALKPTATWVSEGSVAEKKKMDLTGSVTFAYYKLQVRVAVSLEADTVSLSLFEQTISNNIGEAMIKGAEASVVSGLGGDSGQPLGIANDTRVPAGQIISTATPALWKKYETWTEYLGKVPRKYRSRCVLIMADTDFNKYIVGMVDAEGQPVARTTYGLDGMITEKFIGREVIPTEEYITSIDAASSGDVVAIFCVLDDYHMNSNMQMTYKRYFDEDTDEWISKSTMLADGKLGDPNGVVLIKKA